MPRYSKEAREAMINKGREADYGDITSRQMGAMGGTTTRNLVRLAQAKLEGHDVDVEASDVYVTKDSDAGELDIDLQVLGADQVNEEDDETIAPEARNTRATRRRAKAK